MPFTITQQYEHLDTATAPDLKILPFIALKEKRSAESEDTQSVLGRCKGMSQLCKQHQETEKGNKDPSAANTLL